MPPSSSPLLAGLRSGAATAMDLVLPRPCPGCGGPGPWCEGCDATLRGRPRRVRLPEFGGHAVELPPVWGLARYTDPIARRSWPARNAAAATCRRCSA